MVVGYASEMFGGASATDAVTSVLDGIFTLGTAAQVNQSGQTCYGVFFENVAGKIQTGTYTGDGNATKAITGLGWNPDGNTLICVVAPSGGSAHYHAPTQAGNESQTWGSTVVTTHFSSMDADGFTVKTPLNTSSATYYWWAIKETANLFEAITYTGDESDNRTLTGAGFQPDFAIVDNETGGSVEACLRFSANVGDSSASIASGSGFTTNHIQAFTADGVQVGSAQLVNFAWDYHGLFFKSLAGHMEQATWTGTGAGQSINLSINPAFAIVKVGTNPAAMWIVYPPADEGEVEATQYRLMLAEAANPDIPTLNITSKAITDGGGSLIKTERGRESAVLGRPPRAGRASVVLNNDSLGYNLDQPTPGLAIRLNKFYDGVVYHMWTGNIDVPEHEMQAGVFRAIVKIQANGTLTRLANKKIYTSLLGRGVDSPTTTGAAIVAVLQAAGLPSYMYDIDTGDVSLPYFWANGEDALTLLEMLVNSEGITAEMYEDGDGRVVFRDRTARFDESRSSTIQFTFRAEVATEPRLTGFTYVSGWREIVNYASHERYARTNDDEVTVVWQDDPDNDGYIIGPNQELVFEAKGDQPFYDAITPVLGTDYAVGFGSVSVSLDRTSGQTVNITFLAGAGGATIGQLQLRATATIVGATFQEHSGDYVDASASVTQYGARAWTGSMSKELTWNDMRDNLDAIVTWKMNPIGRIRFGLNAAREGIEIAEANEATAKLEIGDRVRVITTALDFDGECWVERIEHEVFAPAGTADGTAVGREFTWYECSVIEVAVGSQGTGVSDTNPYDTINHEDNVLEAPLANQGMLTMSLAGLGVIAAGP